MSDRFPKALLVAFLVCAAPLARADVWDLGGDNDNDFGSDNELIHGLEQIHDMAVQQGGNVRDVDWYRFNWPNNSSFEVVIDGLTGDLGNGGTAPAFEMLLSDGTTVTSGSFPVTGFGVARSIRDYSGSSGLGEGVYYVRVSNPLCGLTCTVNDQYRIRFYDTTASVPRFNNAGGQVTVLVLQNMTGLHVSGDAFGYDASGTGMQIGGFTIDLLPKQVSTINLATVNGGVLAGRAGGLKVITNAPYGTVTGKAVALEPATGFTFDTPMVYRPH